MEKIDWMNTPPAWEGRSAEKQAERDRERARRSTLEKIAGLEAERQRLAQQAQVAHSLSIRQGSLEKVEELDIELAGLRLQLNAL